MSLLADHDIFLDLDAAKVKQRFMHIKVYKLLVERFQPADLRKRFGVEGTREFENSIAAYRQLIARKLVNFTHKFINGLREQNAFHPLFT